MLDSIAVRSFKFSIFTGMDTMEFFNQIRTGDLGGVKGSLSAHPELLIARDQRGSTPLIMASYYNNEGVVKHLLELGAPVDEKDGSGNTPLMGVCFKGYEEMAGILIEAGADVNARNEMGATCLIFAVTFKKEGVARILIAHGADLTARDSQGKSALDHARAQGLNNLLPHLGVQS